MSGITFDAGGLIALERNNRRVIAILATAREDGDQIHVPATALAQVLRNPAKQVRLWRMIQHESAKLVPLDGSGAQAIGILLAQTGTTDIADAHVVVCARTNSRAIITSNPFDLKRLDPSLKMIQV